MEQGAGLRGVFESGIDVTRRMIAEELHCFNRLLRGIRMDCGKVREWRAFAAQNVEIPTRKPDVRATRGAIRREFSARSRQSSLFRKYRTLRISLRRSGWAFGQRPHCRLDPERGKVLGASF